MTAFNTTREIFAPVEEVFDTFCDSDRLARWWGPAGFTNTFDIFEFKTGGRWVYTMHSPNGGNPENESIFELVEPPAQNGGKASIVIRHNSQPLYRLSIDLVPTAAGTMVSWSQAFEDAAVARRIAKVVVPANEQNLDRLTAEVLGRRSTRGLFHFSTATRHDPAVDAWFAGRKNGLGELARTWFSVMLDRGDDVRELLHDGHPTACAGDAAFGYVNAFTDHVNVGFFRGAELSDPSGLLQGTGKLMRHVKLRANTTVNVCELTALIQNAYADIQRRKTNDH